MGLREKKERRSLSICGLAISGLEKTFPSINKERKENAKSNPIEWREGFGIAYFGVTG